MLPVDISAFELKTLLDSDPQEVCGFVEHVSLRRYRFSSLPVPPYPLTRLDNLRDAGHPWVAAMVSVIRIDGKPLLLHLATAWSVLKSTIDSNVPGDISKIIECLPEIQGLRVQVSIDKDHNWDFRIM